jgi:hypothetical protein
MADGITIVSGIVGGVLTLLGQGALKWLDHQRSEKGEQRKLAQELLLRTEHFCKEVARRRWKSEKPSIHDDPLDAMSDEISAMAVGLRDPKARQHMESIRTTMWFVLNDLEYRLSQPFGAHNPYPIRMAAREILGALQRGEALPSVLPPDFVKMLEDANNLDAQMESQIAAEEAYAREQAEEKARRAKGET